LLHLEDNLLERLRELPAFIYAEESPLLRSASVRKALGDLTEILPVFDTLQFGLGLLLQIREVRVLFTFRTHLDLAKSYLFRTNVLFLGFIVIFFDFFPAD